MNPRSGDLRNRLAIAAKRAADDAALDLDIDAQDTLGTLVNQAAERLGTDPEPRRIRDAERSFQKLAVATAIVASPDEGAPGETLSPDLGERIKRSRPVEGARSPGIPVRVTSEYLTTALGGLCPGFFPFC